MAIESRTLLPRLKQLLYPIRPAVLPIWHEVQPFIEPTATSRTWIMSQEARYGVSDRVDVLRGRDPGQIRPLRRHEFDLVAKRHGYYKARSGYTRVAGELAGELIARRGLSTALELGSHLRPLIVGADTMDVVVQLELEAEGRSIVHDATATPWPLPDKFYDLFVALQVFEHLGTSQAEVFREVCRVARHAIISLPIDWRMPDPANCHHMISAETALSWFYPVVPTRIKLGNGGTKKRYVYVFEDLPTPS